MKTYYQKYQRNFANEYILGIARNIKQAKSYLDAGYDRIMRRKALQAARYQGDAATEAFVQYNIGGPKTSQVTRADYLDYILLNQKFG